MPRITPKPPELIEAQLATYAAEHVSQHGDKMHILNNLGTLGLSAGKEPIIRTTHFTEYEHMDNMERIPTDTERVAATREDYVEFLRSTRGLGYEATRERAEIIGAYAHFQPVVNRLKAEVSGLQDPKEHPQLLGYGAKAYAFKLTEDDQAYAVRIMRDTAKGPGIIEGYIGGAVKVKGVPHFEQMVAVSYKDGVTISEVAPGKGLGDMTSEENDHITDEQLSELVDALIIAQQRGVGIDPKPNNFMYDQSIGYTLLDINGTHADSDVGDIAGQMADVIENTGFYSKWNGSTQDMLVDDFAHDLKTLTAKLGVLRRYRKVVTEKLDEIQQQIAFEYMDKVIVRTQTTIDNYSNPRWVADEIARNEARKRRAKGLAQKEFGLDELGENFNFM